MTTSFFAARVDPSQGFMGGRVSKKVLWLGGGLLALVLALTVSIIAGKGQRVVTETAPPPKATSNPTQGGLNEILASAPQTPQVQQEQQRGGAKSQGSAGGSGQGAGAQGTVEEDPSVRQARQAAEREALRLAQLKQQQFEAALGSNGVVSVDLYENERERSGPARNPAEQALANLVASQGSMAPQALPDPNKQDNKIAFSQEARRNTYLTRGRELPLSDLELKVGTVIPATLVSGINSDLPGQVIAQVNQHVYDSATHSTILLPQGSQLVGVYDSRVAYGQDRLLMAWTRVNFPDGSTLELEGMGGADAAGYAGFVDEVDHHYFKIFGNALLLGLISGVSQSAVSDGNGNENSTAEEVNNGVVEQFATVGTTLTQKNLDVQPTIKIRNGYKFNIMLNKDVVLPAYQLAP